MEEKSRWGGYWKVRGWGASEEVLDCDLPLGQSGVPGRRVKFATKDS